METFLLIVTFVALSLAVVMAVLAWKLLRDDKRRAAARVEALRAFASEEEAEDEVLPATLQPVIPSITAPPPPPVPAATAFSRPAAAAPRDDAPWDARLGLDHSAVRSVAPANAALIGGAAGMFAAAAEPTGAPSRRWLALAAVGAVMALIVTGMYALYGPGTSAAAADASSIASAGSAAASRPLELLSLRHAVDADGTFTVTGLVQNPADGRMVQHVDAVVYLFDRDGNYFASGKSSLDFTALHPGEESPFVVKVTAPGHVSRYRVGFRSSEGGVIAHVDRRSATPSTSGDGLDHHGAQPALNVTPRKSEG